MKSEDVKKRIYAIN